MNGRLAPEHLLNIPALLAELKERSPSQFIKRLRHYPNDDNNDDESFHHHLPVLLAQFCRGNPDPLMGELKRQSSVKDNDASSLSGAIVFMPGERKSMTYIDFLSGLVNQSIKPQLFIVTVPNKPRQVRPVSRPDLHDTGHYLESLVISLLAGRRDFITKGVNLNIAQEEGLAIMDGSYADIGGEQGFGESLAQGYLDKRSEGILEASIQDGEALAKAQEALNTLKIVMSRYKKESTKELKETEELHKLTKPLSLDTEVEDEEGGTTPLSEWIPAEEDLLEAVDGYYEAVSKLPQDMQPIFRRVWEKGETPKQAAINLGYEWTSALERKVERMIKKIREEMLS